MRLEATEKPDQYRVWLTDSEIEDLRRATTGYRDDIIIQLGAFVGLRSFEVPQIQPRHIKTTESGQYRLRVPEGKDTTGSGGKPRDAYLPDDVERSLQQFANAENIAPREPFAGLSGRGVRAAVKRTADTDGRNQMKSTHEDHAVRRRDRRITRASCVRSFVRQYEAAANETGETDFRHVSSHDLRRRFAQRLLVDENMNPRVVMQVGGWDSFQAIEPYLNAPTPEVVDEAFTEIDR